MFFLVTFVSATALIAQPVYQRHVNDTHPPTNQSILLALLLDTSNSMDGLIDQAKSQLWKIVNELAVAKGVDGIKPNIKIALYEYGNSRLPASDGYIRQVSDLTDDLDLISEKLFSLSTNGGHEFCGQVINASLHELNWSTSRADLKMIFIAGNEPFTQGEVPYPVACALANEKDVVVNTIFCGNYQEGVATGWKDGADITHGSYMNIDHNIRTVYIATPYDAKINALNDQLNDTYIFYGRSGAERKAKQLSQDKNAESYGQANKVERSVSKSTYAYKNTSWDLVDAVKENEKVISTIEDANLPVEMRNMTLEQRRAYVVKKAEERKRIQGEIQSLNAKRQEYIVFHSPKSNQTAMFDVAMIKAIREKAKSKNLTW